MRRLWGRADESSLVLWLDGRSRKNDVGCCQRKKKSMEWRKKTEKVKQRTSKFLYGNSIGRRGKELLARYGILDLQFLLKKTANERWRWGVW
jgi:hypothetical protein